MRTLFAVVIVGELFAFVIVLASADSAIHGWSRLGFASMFIQWVGLSSAAMLCLCRPWLRRMTNIVAGLVGYALIMGITLALSEASYWLLLKGVVGVDALPWRAIDPIHGLVGVASDSGLTGHGRFLIRNLTIGAIVTALALRYFYVQHQWRMNLESESRARIQALQSRIRPHFLFNSMNTIASLTRSQPELAEQVTEDLADLFRVSLGDASIPVSLERELEVCQQYLRIERQRLGDRLSSHWDVDGLPIDAVVPGLIVQPLIENAVYHGIEPAAEGGTIDVRGRRDGATLNLSIANSISPDRDRSHRPGNQMAQDNVDQRLQAFFGTSARLEAYENGDRYVIELEFPYVTEGPG